MIQGGVRWLVAEAMTAVVLAVEMSAQCAFLVAMGPPHSPEPILILTNSNDCSTPNLRNE